MMKKLAALGILTFFLVVTVVTHVSAAEYEVKAGDSLWAIAEQHDMTVERLIEINDLRTTLIKPKQMLLLAEAYEVQQGDTLEKISQQFNVTVQELKDWNQLNSAMIKPGQILYIHESKVKEEQTEVAPSSMKAAQSKEEKPQGKTLTVTATAYTAKCDGCSGITYTGVNLNKNPHAKVIAVDPRVIPLGSKVYVEGYGYAIAADIGGAIKGQKIDLHVPTKAEAYQWGVRKVKVTILD